MADIPKLFVGTSGYSYKEWKGSFYPEKLPANRFLEFYAQRFGSVEINNTFYRMPKPDLLAKWSEAVPDDFRFVLKASKRITHNGRIKPESVTDPVRYFFENSATMGDKLGAVLFQLPAYVRADHERLGNFLELLPEGGHHAMEFRHRSWFVDETYEALKNKNVAMCLVHADDDEGEGAIVSPEVATADFGYLRLRSGRYQENDLKRWAKLIQSQSWDRAFVFFKHEDEGHGPRLAQRFVEQY